MSERLRQFVLDVSNDPDRAKRLTADPTAELDQSDLSPEERQVILARDPDVLRQALGADQSDILQMNSFFKKPPAKPGGPAKPKPRPGKPARPKPSRKAPAQKKRTARRTVKRTVKRTAPKRPTARKGARKTARKGSKGRRR